VHALVNILGALTVGLCAVLLLRAYVRTRSRLLLWSGACFLGLTIANALLFVDLAIVPDADLYLWRLAVAGTSIVLLVHGLIFESE
jgi:hypothetical protein